MRSIKASIQPLGQDLYVGFRQHRDMVAWNHVYLKPGSQIGPT